MAAPVFSAMIVLMGGPGSELEGKWEGAIEMGKAAGGKPKIYHTFSRIHGDLERDYNYFQIDSTYYSSGPGNFRDVNQNRRDDNKQPLVGDFNALMFLSLVQPDEIGRAHV